MIASGSTVTQDDRLAWLETRKTGLGASDASSVLGINPWKSPLALYLEKIGESDPIEETEPMRVGKLLEPIIAGEYERRHGVKLHQQVFLRHPGYPEIFATLDAMRPDGRPVEFKSVGLRSAGEWGEDGSDEIPIHYRAQVYHQLAVSGAEACDVIALIGGQEFRQYTIPRVIDLIRGLLTIELDFWEGVCARRPPEDFEPGDHRLWHKLHPGDAGAISLDDEDRIIVDRYLDASKRKNHAAQEEADLKTQVLAILGPFGLGSLPDGRSITRKVISIEASTYTRKAYQYTDLRVKKAKS
jgi:putative phage-type endonuclease